MLDFPLKESESRAMSPDEVCGHIAETISDEVFTVFNRKIAENWTGTGASFSREDVIDRISFELEEPKSKTYGKSIKLFKQVSLVYQSRGWKVVEEYDRITDSNIFKFSKEA